jgi:hypothetical protein
MTFYFVPSWWYFWKLEQEGKEKLSRNTLEASRSLVCAFGDSDRMSAMLAAQSGSQDLAMENGSPDIAPYGDGGDFHAHLQRFVVAKAQIITVYKNLSSYLVETGSFLEDSFTIASKVSQSYDQILKEARLRAENYSEKVSGISGVLKRDRMNVVFFGRTSNGKSTMINALLGENILPTVSGTFSYNIVLCSTNVNLFPGDRSHDELLSSSGRRKLQRSLRHDRRFQ